MVRRRLTFATYVRRRWRPLGAIGVLLLGALLVLAVTDRGHDPIWETPAAQLDQATVSPDGNAAYALLREDDNITRLVAHRAPNGDLAWESALSAPRALLAAGTGGVAVATDFPRAFLTFYDTEGAPHWQVPLEGNPAALAVDGARVALALTAPGNPLLIYENGELLHTHRVPGAIRALDMRGGLTAVGGINGHVGVFRDGEILLERTLPLSARSLRLADDATSLVVGGATLGPDGPHGGVVFLDVGVIEPQRWTRQLPASIGLVDLDATGLVVLAVEETPPTASIHLLDGATGATRWTRRFDGSVARDDAGQSGGASIGSDGRSVAIGTLRGDLLVLDAKDGRVEWSYRAGGVVLASFAHDKPHRLLAGARILETHEFNALLLFSDSQEPLADSAPVAATALVSAAAITASLLVGVGYWRARRPY